MDRPGVYIRDGYPQNDPTYDRLKALINAKTDLKHSWHPCWAKENSRSSFNVEPYNGDFERHVTILHTPAGDLQSVFLQNLKGQPGLRVEYLLKTRNDAEKYLSLLPEAPQCAVTGFFEADRAIGDRGIAEVQLGFNPAGYVVELFGSETFAIVSATDRDIIHQLCRRQLDIVKTQIKFLIANNVGPYFAMCGEEYIVPPLHGPTDFYDFNVRYDKPIIDLIHEAGGRIHVHSHGSIRNVFEGFIDMGVDVLHPFEPPPMGDITAAQAKELARSKLCLEGNIQIASMYENSPSQIQEETTSLIEDAFDDNQGLIVCPTASPYLFSKGEDCLDQFKAMIKAVLAWKS